MKIISIQIINPDTNAPVSVEDWKKDKKPTRAEWVVITTDELKPFKLHKKLASKGKFLDFREALEGGNTLTRAQGVALYNAEYNGLREAMVLIGGDPIPGLVWTCEEDDDHQDDATYAWFVNLNFGYMYRTSKLAGYQVRLVASL